MVLSAPKKRRHMSHVTWQSFLPRFFYFSCFIWKDCLRRLKRLLRTWKGKKIIDYFQGKIRILWLILNAELRKNLLLIKINYNWSSKNYIFVSGHGFTYMYKDLIIRYAQFAVKIIFSPYKYAYIIFRSSNSIPILKY